MSYLTKLVMYTTIEHVFLKRQKDKIRDLAHIFLDRVEKNRSNFLQMVPKRRTKEVQILVITKTVIMGKIP